MNDKKYPIGTKIKYIGYCENCKNKIGEIIKVRENNCTIILPKSTCSMMKRLGRVTCSWSDIELAVRKNQQLLFAFMDE